MDNAEGAETSKENRDDTGLHGLAKNASQMQVTIREHRWPAYGPIKIPSLDVMASAP